MGSYSTYYETLNLLQGSMMNQMGTRLDVLLFGAEKAETEQVWRAVENEVSRLDKMLNKFDPESELFAVNSCAKDAPVYVKEELWNILMDCQRYHQMTQGYFDISLKDLNKVEFGKNEQSVFFAGEAFQLDLGGYAKGYALQKIQNILLSHGITQAFLNFGNSSVLGLGSHPHGESWKVGIVNPFVSKEMLGSVELHDSTMSTSGNMPQHSGHIIKPATGEYTQERKLVTIVAENAVDAEVLSTTLMVAEGAVAQDIVSNFNIDQSLVFNL